MTWQLIIVCVAVLMISAALYFGAVLWHRLRASREYPAYYTAPSTMQWTGVGAAFVLGLVAMAATMRHLAELMA